MTEQLFPSSSSDLFSPSQEAPVDTTSAGYDIESIMMQLMQQTGCSADEAGAAIVRQLEAKKKAQALPDVPYSKLRTETERKEYMKRIRENVAQSTWIPPQLREAAEADMSVAQAQAQFAENMKNKSNAHPMRNNQAAIEFFRNMKK